MINFGKRQRMKGGVTLRDFRSGIILLLVAGFLAMIVLFSSYLNAEAKKETMAIGNTIIAALQAYRKDLGEYPESLETLKPIYLKEIPQPIWGNKEWKYERFENDMFQLAVGENKDMYPCLYYNSYDMAHWTYDN